MISRVFITSTSAILPTTSSMVTPSVSTTPGGTGSDDDGLSDAAIVGIVVGVMIGAALFVIVAIIIACRLVVNTH